MKIKDSTLRQIIREEYSRLINEGDDDAPKTVKQQLSAAIAAENKHGSAMTAGFLKVIQKLHNDKTLSDEKAVANFKQLNKSKWYKFSAQAQAAMGL